MVFDDDGVPLGTWIWDEDLEEWIFDEYVPLVQFPPQTGDSGTVALFLVLFIAAAFTAVILLKGRRRVG